MTRRPFLTFVAVALLILVAVRPAHADGWKVIVHPSNPTPSITKGKLSKLLLKTTTTWENGNKVMPVDQKVTSGTRDAMSRAVHGRSARVIKNWWNQQIFAGKGVPPEPEPWGTWGLGQATTRLIVARFSSATAGSGSG